MVSNSSSLGDDLGALGSTVGDAAQDVGQALGLVEADLIPGDAAATGEIAAHLSKLAGAFERAGQGFKAIDTGSWQGQAADAARGHLEIAPPKWLNAGDTFGDAGRAVADYQRVLAEMQHTAAEAKQRLEQAKQASDNARAVHNARVDAYNTAADEAAASARPLPRPPAAFQDPAAADIADAQRTITQAQAAVREAGDRAARAVLAAAEAAPAEPGLMTQLKENLVDSAQAAGRTVGSVAAGAVGAVADLGKLVRSVTPLDPYNITHPAAAQENMATLAMGLVGAAQNRYGTVKTVVDVDGWKNEPAKTMGACIPDAIASIAGGAGVASRVARSVGKVADHAGDLGRAGRGADEIARGPAPPPPSPSSLPPRPPSPPTTQWGPQWGRWPEPGQRPDLPGQHPAPRGDPAAPPRGAGETSPHTEQPWRPSDPNTPSSRGERDFAEPPTGRDPLHPDSPRQSERLVHPGPEPVDERAARRMSWHDEDVGAPASWMDNGSGRHDPPPELDDLRHTPDPDPRPPHPDPGDGPHGHDSGHDGPGQDHARDLPERGSSDRPSLGELFPERGGTFDEDRAKQVLTDHLAGKFGDLNVSIREVSPNTLQDTSSYAVRTDIHDDTGRTVGHATHDVYRPEHGGGLIGVVNNVHLDPNVRGAGFGTEFNRAWEDWLTESGADRIHLRANVDVGSYSWARQGYDFANEAEAVNKIGSRLEDGIARTENDLAELTRQRAQPGADHEALTREIESREQLLISAREVSSRMYAGCDEFPTPREISELGRPDGLEPGQSQDKWWLGKDVLMDSSGQGRVEWQAVKKL